MSLCAAPRVLRYSKASRLRSANPSHELAEILCDEVRFSDTEGWPDGTKQSAPAHSCGTSHEVGASTRFAAAPATSALHWDWAHPCHICAGTGLTPPTSAPGLVSPLPHLRRDWAHPAHICTGTGAHSGISAPGLRQLYHVHIGTKLTPAPSASRLRPPRRICVGTRLAMRDWAHPSRIATRHT